MLVISCSIVYGRCWEEYCLSAKVGVFEGASTDGTYFVIEWHGLRSAKVSIAVEMIGYILPETISVLEEMMLEIGSRKLDENTRRKTW